MPHDAAEQSVHFAMDAIEHSERTDRPSDIHVAIRAARDAADRSPRGGHRRVYFLSQISDLTSRLAVKSGDQRLVDEAEAIAHYAVQDAGTFADVAIGALIYYWKLHSDHSDRLVPMSDPELVVSATIRVASDPTLKASDRDLLLEGSYTALDTRFANARLPSDGDARIRVARCGRSLLENGLSSGPWVNRLIVDLQERAEATRYLPDVDEAADLARGLLVDERVDPETRVAAWSELATALKVRFEICERIEDLNSAIEAAREGIGQSASHANIRWQIEQNLASMLLVRHDRFGARDDLDEASRLADVRSVSGGFENAAILINLASARLTQAGFTGEPRDRRKAIDTARSAVRAAKLFPQVMADAEHALAVALALDLGFAVAEVQAGMAERLPRSAPREIDEAVMAAETALRSSHPDHAMHRARSKSLAQALETRFDIRGARADVDRAIDILRRMSHAAGHDDPDLIDTLTDLGIALKKRYVALGDDSDYRGAAHALRTAATSESSPVPVRLNAATTWAALEAGVDPRSPACLEAHSVAVDTLAQLVWFGADESDVLRRMSGWQTTAADAAACYLSAGRPHDGMAVLERGRGLVWSLRFGSGINFSTLEETAPALAVQLSSLLHELRFDAEGGPVAGMSMTDRVRRMEVWKQKLAEAQQIDPGIMAGPVSAHDVLRQLPPNAALVVITCSDIRSDAIVYTAAGVHVVHLNALTPTAAQQNAEKYHQSIGKSSRLWQRRSPEDEIADVLAWLWTTIVEPVASTAGFAESISRIWWCPTGPLSLLPVHAAQGRTTTGNLRSLMDVAVSSYVPTLRSFVENRPFAAQPSDSMLVVSVPRSRVGDAAELSHVRDEVEFISHAVRGVNLLADDDASADAVVAALPRTTAVHFSCHGVQSGSSPSSSGLLVQDRMISIQEIAASSGGGDLAFLSASDSALGIPANADEVVSIAGALQFSGWRQVVGTFASVRDDIAADVAVEFYRRVTGPDGRINTDSAAIVLHDVVARVRLQHPDHPGLWSPFAHFGS